VGTIKISQQLEQGPMSGINAPWSFDLSAHLDFPGKNVLPLTLGC